VLDRLDHLVLTVADIDVTVEFYERVLGMTARSFTSAGVERRALHFGDHKINLHQAGAEFEPKARTPLAGSADLCFTTQKPVDEIAADLAGQGVEIIDGPVARTGARGALRSIYLRDPDGNLIEIANET